MKVKYQVCKGKHFHPDSNEAYFPQTGNMCNMQQLLLLRVYVKFYQIKLK